jgi:hypothetical protein
MKSEEDRAGTIGGSISVRGEMWLFRKTQKTVSPPLTPRRRSTGGSSIEVVVSTGTTESEEHVEKSTNPFDDFF